MMDFFCFRIRMYYMTLGTGYTERACIALLGSTGMVMGLVF